MRTHPAEKEPARMLERPALSPNHERRISVTFRHVDKMLADIEDALHVSESRMAFPQHTQDVDPEHRAVIEKYISRIRAGLVRALERQGIAQPEADIPVSRSVRTILTFVEIALEELQPRYMRGYGEVPPERAAELNEISAELRETVRELNRYLTQSGL